jgi:hypothetical protein
VTQSIVLFNIDGLVDSKRLRIIVDQPLTPRSAISSPLIALGGGGGANGAAGQVMIMVVQDRPVVIVAPMMFRGSDGDGGDGSNRSIRSLVHWGERWEKISRAAV